MKEQIILSNINDRELLRSLALNNKGSFNIRIFNAENLAKEALIRSGTIITEKIIDNTKQECIIYNIIKSVDSINTYFKNSTFIDAKNIVQAINYARELCRGDEETKINEVFNDGEFKEKNEAILKIYKNYQDYLNKNDCIDSIGVINYAIAHAKPIDAQFITFEETPLEPLEEELLKTLAYNQEIKDIKIRNFVNLKDKKLSGLTYADAYGSVNEVEYILGYIGKNQIPYEECVIALIDDSYLEHFLAYKTAYNIPFTFGSGLNIRLSNAYKVLILLSRWKQKYNSVEGLTELINAPEFNSEKFWANVSMNKINNKEKADIINAVGNLKIKIDLNLRNKQIATLNNYKYSLSSKEEIERLPLIESFINELFKGYAYLIKNYTRIENSFDDRAIKTICSYIEEFYKELPEEDIDTIIEGLSNSKISRELSQPQAIHITDLKGALTCIRKHLFICGLNSRSFPGSPNENYLLLDSDLERFKEANTRNSQYKIQINKKLLKDVINNASAFDCHIHLSYSGYNLSELKQENASSMLFNIFADEYGDNSTFEDLRTALGKQHHYFEEDISKLKNIGNQYLNGINTKPELMQEDCYTPSLIRKAISPSAADIFFECPRRFYLTKILGITEPQDDDYFNPLLPNDEGTLIHECMQDYGNNPNWNEAEFMANANNKFNDYLKKRIPVHTKNIEARKKEFLQMAKEGYNHNPGNTVVCSEKYLGPYTDPISGLSFGGIVDRIEKLPNGKYQIVDYKTYKNIKNEENDIDSCFQVCLYAYIFENYDNDDKKEIERCEYRYLRNPRVVVCEYDEAIKMQLQDKLNQIKQALDSGNYPYAENKDEACKYCKLQAICGIKEANDTTEKEEE